MLLRPAAEAVDAGGQLVPWCGGNLVDYHAFG
jgi:hypothetical protein